MSLNCEADPSKADISSAVCVSFQKFEMESTLRESSEFLRVDVTTYSSFTLCLDFRRLLERWFLFHTYVTAKPPRIFNADMLYIVVRDCGQAPIEHSCSVAFASGTEPRAER